MENENKQLLQGELPQEYTVPPENNTTLRVKQPPVEYATSSGSLYNTLLKLDAVTDCDCTIPRDLLAPAKDDRFVFLQVQKGQCLVNGGPFQASLREKDCAFFPCSSALKVDPSTQRCKISGVAVSGENLPALYHEYLSCGGRDVFQPLCSTQFINALDQMKSAARTPNCIQDLQINLTIYELMNALIYEARSAETHAVDNSNRSDMQMVRDYLEQHFREKITLEDLEKNFFFSRFYISYVFREQFGVTVSEYLTHVRVEEAKKLLAGTENKIEAVAFQSGFGSASYFWRTFKAATGTSPSAYRTARRTK